MLKMGARKIIGNGNFTNFWKDPWIDVSTLSAHDDLNPLKQSLNMICGKKVCDYIK